MADPKPAAKKPATKDKPKKAPAEPKVVNLADEEKKIQADYPDRKIIKGSIKDAGTLKEFGNKRTVEIKCGTEGCKTIRRVATSDLHQVGNCEECIKTIRLERRKSARSKTSKKKAPPKAQTATGANKKTNLPNAGATGTTKKPNSGATKKPTTKPAAKKTVTIQSPMDQPPSAHPVPPPAESHS